VIRDWAKLYSRSLWPGEGVKAGLVGKKGWQPYNIRRGGGGDRGGGPGTNTARGDRMVVVMHGLRRDAMNCPRRENQGKIGRQKKQFREWSRGESGSGGRSLCARIRLCICRQEKQARCPPLEASGKPLPRRGERRKGLAGSRGVEPRIMTTRMRSGMENSPDLSGVGGGGAHEGFCGGLTRRSNDI